MALLGVQLYQSLRSRVELGDTAVRITLPQGSGATPMLRFVNTEIPYDQIEAVETRRVLFGNAMAPVLLRATRLRTKDGQHVRLGNVNEDNVDAGPALPRDRRQASPSAPASRWSTAAPCAARSSGACSGSSGARPPSRRARR